MIRTTRHETLRASNRRTLIESVLIILTTIGGLFATTEGTGALIRFGASNSFPSNLPVATGLQCVGVDRKPTGTKDEYGGAITRLSPQLVAGTGKTALTNGIIIVFSLDDLGRSNAISTANTAASVTIAEPKPDTGFRNYNVVTAFTDNSGEFSKVECPVISLGSPNEAP